MPLKKETKQQSYSKTKILLGAGLATLATVNLYFILSGLCEEEENSAVSRESSGVMASLLCPVFTFGTMMFASSKKIDKPEGETCLGTLDGPGHTPYDGNLHHARNYDDVLDATNGLFDDVLQRFSSVKNTIYHFQVMNHQYDRIHRIDPRLTKEDHVALCNAKDINGRTPFFLSLCIGAPGKIQRLLATEVNVNMPDINGLTPLKLVSMGFTNLKTTQYILSLISDEAFKNESIDDYSFVTREKIKAHLESYEVQPDKASNFCTDTINAGHEPICFPPEVVEKSRGIFDIGKVSAGSKKLNCVIATKKSIGRVRVDTRIEKYKPHYEEAKRLYPEVSDKSITDVILERQAENIALIHARIEEASQSRNIIRRNI